MPASTTLAFNALREARELARVLVDSFMSFEREKKNTINVRRRLDIFS